MNVARGRLKLYHVASGADIGQNDDHFSDDNSALFPSSAWEHTFSKLRFAILHRKQSFRKTRDQALLGHEDKLTCPTAKVACQTRHRSWEDRVVI